jgi:hypothetical protein
VLKGSLDAINFKKVSVVLQLAAIAILFRQTNVVWVIFVTCTGVLEILKSAAPPTVETQEDDVVSYSQRVIPRDVDGSQVSKTRRRKAGQISPPDRVVLDPLSNQKVSNGQEDQGTCYILLL